MDQNAEGCPDESCRCGSSPLPRREFIAIAGLGLAGLFTTSEAVAGPFEGQDFEQLIPLDKKFRPEWLGA